MNLASLFHPCNLQITHMTIASYKYSFSLFVLPLSKSEIELADSFKDHIVVCRVTAM